MNTNNIPDLLINKDFSNSLNKNYNIYDIYFLKKKRNNNIK